MRGTVKRREGRSEKQCGSRGRSGIRKEEKKREEARKRAERGIWEHMRHVGRETPSSHLAADGQEPVAHAGVKVSALRGRAAKRRER